MKNLVQKFKRSWSTYLCLAIASYLLINSFVAHRTPWWEIVAEIVGGLILGYIVFRIIAWHIFRKYK